MKKIFARIRGSTIWGFFLIIAFIAIMSIGSIAMASVIDPAFIEHHVAVVNTEAYGTGGDTEVLQHAEGICLQKNSISEKAQMSAKDESVSRPRLSIIRNTFIKTASVRSINQGYHSLKMPRLFLSEANLNNLTASRFNTEYQSNC